MKTPYAIQVVESGSITEPVTVGDAKDWMKVDYADDDSLISSMITGAREDIEQELNLKLVDSTASFYLDTTRCGEMVGTFPYALNLSQVSDLVVNLIEDGQTDVTQTLDSDYYFNGSLKIANASTNRIEYTITPVVPQSIKEAIKMLVSYRYNNRGDQAEQQGIPVDILSKISRWRQIWL
jgi:hypothetical protein